LLTLVVLLVVLLVVVLLVVVLLVMVLVVLLLVVLLLVVLVLAWSWGKLSMEERSKPLEESLVEVASVVKVGVEVVLPCIDAAMALAKSS
jgi:hypothetical protein